MLFIGMFIVFGEGFLIIVIDFGCDGLLMVVLIGGV